MYHEKVFLIYFIFKLFIWLKFFLVLQSLCTMEAIHRGSFIVAWYLRGAQVLTTSYTYGIMGMGFQKQAGNISI